MVSKNWMPTLAAVISAAASLMIFMQFGGFYDFPRWVLGILAFIQAGGTAALGITAKQYNVTGGNVGQPSTPQALADSGQDGAKVVIANIAVDAPKGAELLARPEEYRGVAGRE